MESVEEIHTNLSMEEKSETSAYSLFSAHLGKPLQSLQSKRFVLPSLAKLTNVKTLHLFSHLLWLRSKFSIGSFYKNTYLFCPNSFFPYWQNHAPSIRRHTKSLVHQPPFKRLFCPQAPVPVSQNITDSSVRNLPESRPFLHCQFRVTILWDSSGLVSEKLLRSVNLTLTLQKSCSVQLLRSIIIQTFSVFNLDKRSHNLLKRWQQTPNRECPLTP